MKILIPNFSLAEYKRNVWRVTALHGQSFEEFMEPEVWAHVSFNFKRFDEVEIIAEDGSFYARGLVLKTTKTSATVKFYTFVDLDGGAITQDKDARFIVEWGGRAKWRIIRKSDGEVIDSQIGTKEEAQQKADNLSKEGE